MRLDERTVFALAHGSHFIDGLTLEEVQRTTVAMRVESAPIGQKKIDGAEVGPLASSTNEGFDEVIRIAARGGIGNPVFVEEREQRQEEALAVSVSDALSAPRRGDALIDIADVLDRAV